MNELIWGVPVMQFIYRVLIPETAICLIEEDLHLINSTADRRTAIKIKAESTDYGNMVNSLE